RPGVRAFLAVHLDPKRISLRLGQDLKLLAVIVRLAMQANEPAVFPEFGSLIGVLVSDEELGDGNIGPAVHHRCAIVRPADRDWVSPGRFVVNFDGKSPVFLLACPGYRLGQETSSCTDQHCHPRLTPQFLASHNSSPSSRQQMAMPRIGT